MKVIYNKLLPVQGFTAINLFGLVFARKEERPLDAVLIRHELIHTLQMVECAAVSLVIVIPLVILGFTLWLFLIPLVAFYVLICWGIYCALLSFEVAHVLIGGYRSNERPILFRLSRIADYWDGCISLNEKRL